MNQTAMLRYVWWMEELKLVLVDAAPCWTVWGLGGCIYVRWLIARDDTSLGGLWDFLFVRCLGYGFGSMFEMLGAGFRVWFCFLLLFSRLRSSFLSFLLFWHLQMYGLSPSLLPARMKRNKEKDGIGSFRLRTSWLEVGWCLISEMELIWTAFNGRILVWGTCRADLVEGEV